MTQTIFSAVFQANSVQTWFLLDVFFVAKTATKMKVNGNHHPIFGDKMG
jgi:hypothetical protein